MAATVVVKQATGSGPTLTTITNLRFKTADDPSGTDTTYPLVRPSAGSNYSYVVWLLLSASTTPAGTINNVKFYTDGTLFTDSSLVGVLRVKGITTASYTQAAGTPGTSGTLSAAVYTSGADWNGWTSGSPLSVSGSITNPSTGTISDYVALQAIVTTDQEIKTETAETLTWRYDET